MGEGSFPWKNKHISCLSNVKRPALKMCMPVTLHELTGNTWEYVYMYILFIYVITLDENWP